MGHLKNLAASVVLAAALLSGLPAAAEMVYHRGNTADPETLDQHKTSTVYEGNILRDLYEGLVIYDSTANVVPGVAESWQLSDDGKTYTFRLRADAKWSNGDPVTAGDFVYSLRRIMMPETAAKYANVLYAIENAEPINAGELPAKELGVAALDDRTLQITLAAPTPYFLELLTHQTGLPVHAPSVEKHGADFVRPENMVSNGAFTLEEFTPNAHVKLVKNLNFHAADSVRIDTVYVYPTEDRSAALRRFQAGELHSNSDAPVEQVAWMRENLGGQFRVSPYLGTYYYAVKTDKAPLSDPRVRQALSMAIDREFLAEEIWGGTMVAAYSFVPPGIGNYGDPAFAAYKDMSMIDREDAAAALVKEAGFGPDNPLAIEIRYNTSENHKNTALAIADMWQLLGVEATLLNTDTATHYARLRDKGDFDVARAGWIADYNDPQNFLFMVESDNDGFNYANYANPEYDALMDRAAAESDLDVRARLLLEVEQIFMRDLPFIPLMYYGSLSLVSDRLEGWEDNIQNVHASRWMSVKE
ncbi:MAG: peptide ABC transporter substrate-binding protein [Kiloniellales bacterium]